MSKLEFGTSKRQKRRVIALLGGVNLISLITFVTVFLRAGHSLSFLLGLVIALGIATWLFSFVLLIINVASYFMMGEPARQRADTRERHGSRSAPR